mmetsp:Transcript_3717/g.6344  ORF Transcript_3717/g.6344 Transcript_3717/m.6344 type:complete len:92 (+) Transcript_3717:640-915(+)
MSTGGVVIPQLLEILRELGQLVESIPRQMKRPWMLCYIGKRDDVFAYADVVQNTKDVSAMLKESPYFSQFGLEVKLIEEEGVVHEVSPCFF